MDKYQAAIVRYEKARSNIEELSDKIKYWAVGFFDGDRFVTDHTCQISEFNTPSCIEKLWEANKQNAMVDYCLRHHPSDCDCHGGGDAIPELCESCSRVQFYIDERKKQKKELGIAKRQISALAKGLIKNV